MVEPYVDETLMDPRVLAILRDLESVPGRQRCRCGGGAYLHYADCWRNHAGCLAHRIRRTLTGETDG
jgi:hypothetical protein